MIFAREISDDLTSLVKKIDAATKANQAASMGSFVVFLSDDEDLERQLKGLARKEGIKETVLAIDAPAGPKGYSIHKEAYVTVVLYTKHNVKANFAFRKGEMKAADIDKILKSVPKILPEK